MLHDLGWCHVAGGLAPEAQREIGFQSPVALAPIPGLSGVSGLGSSGSRKVIPSLVALREVRVGSLSLTSEPEQLCLPVGAASWLGHRLLDAASGVFIDD